MRRRALNYILYLGIAWLLIFSLSPFLWMLCISLARDPYFLFTGNTAFTLHSYITLFRETSLHFPGYIFNSLLVSITASLTVTLFAVSAAYALSRLQFPGRIIIPLVMLAFSMFPQISIVGYLYTLLSRFNLINTHQALILSYTAWTMPLAVWITMSYFSQIPGELDKAALIDGATRTAILFKIILPLALPGIFSAFLLTFIACFNEFLFAVMLTTDYYAQTLPVGIAFFEGVKGEIPWSTLMAASAICALPLIILVLICQRYIVQGLLSGALKG